MYDNSAFDKKVFASNFNIVYKNVNFTLKNKIFSNQLIILRMTNFVFTICATIVIDFNLFRCLVDLSRSWDELAVLEFFFLLIYKFHGVES